MFIISKNINFQLQTQYLENKCRGIHKPTQYRHVDSGCSNVIGYPVAHPITYAALTETGGVITTCKYELQKISKLSNITSVQKSKFILEYASTAWY